MGRGLKVKGGREEGETRRYNCMGIYIRVYIVKNLFKNIVKNIVKRGKNVLQAEH